MFENMGFNIPAWVCWMAQDMEGVWWGYQVEPNLSHRSWYENEVGKMLRLGKWAENSDWKLSLKRIKQKKSIS